MQNEIKLYSVHVSIKKKYKQKYLEVIEGYKNILKQIMEANSINEFQALKKINDSSIIQPVKTGNKNKDEHNLIVAQEKQRLFISAAFHIKELDLEKAEV